jgi:hypothetical protein
LRVVAVWFKLSLRIEKEKEKEKIMVREQFGPLTNSELEVKV